MQLSGYAAHPSQSRSHNRMQYFFLNRRPIRDRALQHALGEAYRGLLMVGRFPIAFLAMNMPPELVDVNVHPTKLEVRFQDSGRLYSQLLATLRGKFLTTDLTARIQPRPRAAMIRPPATTRPRPPCCGNSLSIGPRGRWPPGAQPRSSGEEPAADPRGPLELRPLPAFSPLSRKRERGRG